MRREGAVFVVDPEEQRALEGKLGPGADEVDVGARGGPCPVCGGDVIDLACIDCGWDEYGGNVFFHRRAAS